MESDQLERPDRQKLEEEVFERTIALMDAWRTFLIDNGSTMGLSFMQIAALTAIRKSQPIPSRMLGQTLRITPGAVTQLVDVLVRECLVVRNENAKDRRISELTITKKGADRLEEITERRRLISVDIYQVLNDDELMGLCLANRKMAEKLQSLQKEHRKEG